jgi:drug/metabolite transporter (DMT)-like permease
MTRLRADALLLVCAIIWGTAFVAQRQAATVSPLLFVAARFALTALVIAPLALLEHRRAGEAGPLSVRSLGIAILIGLCLSAGALMQQWAMTSTTATNGGFLTAIYAVFVPLVNWAVFRESPQKSIILACALSLVGAWLLASGNAAAGWKPGDMILLLSDVVWALHICLISRFMGSVHRPFFLCLLQAVIAACVAGTVCLCTGIPADSALSSVLGPLLYAAIVSGGVAFTLQAVSQRHTPPAEASLIMSLESVFAAIAGAVLLGERLRVTAMLGCGLILLAVVIVEVFPMLSRPRSGGSRFQQR